MNLFDDVEKLITRCASTGIRPGLERIERLLTSLGKPQGGYPAVHVVGTNGKGSTCAYLSSVFKTAGYRTALYTSPHLESPGERLLIDGHPLSAERWLAAAQKTTNAVAEDPILRDDPPSYFELVTAAAFLLAMEEKAEIAVVEAGLGGRLDATNLLSDVVCTVVASISVDHTEYLGDTLEEIAGEKFAVVRPDIPACYVGNVERLLSLFEAQCARVGAKPFSVSKDVVLGTVGISDMGCVFDFFGPDLELKRIRTGMLGRYQVENAALALLALSRLTSRFDGLTESAIRLGMLDARWPGRLEVVSREPLVILDGGHNPDGVAKLVESISELWPHKKMGVVYGVMKDKDYSTCLDILHKLNPALYPTCVPGTERALDAEILADCARRLTWRNSVAAAKDPLGAIGRAAEENDAVLVCGSLHLIGWVRSRIAR